MRVILAALLIVVSISTTGQTYSRKDWPHWLDIDRDCQDTRAEVLIAYSLSGVVEFDAADACQRVLTGNWYDPYTDKFFISSAELDIDHRISLKEAHEMGGKGWTRMQRKVFANDQDNLIPVHRSANRSKGSRYAHQWMPSNQDYWCQYIKSREHVIEKYALNAPEIEIQFNQKVKGAYCDN